jgi:hypothetical protein
VRDCNGLAALDASFYHTTHGVMSGLLVAVLITQVDLHSRDVLADSAQGTLHCATNLSGQRFVTFDVTVDIDLNLRGVLLCEGG